MTKPPPPRVAVVGAGPVGLEAALYAKAAGLGVTVFDTGTPGEYVGRWGHVRMFTPFGWNVSPLGRATLLREKPNRTLPADADHLTGKEYRDAYLTPLAETEPLHAHLHIQTAVLTVGRTGWRKTDPADPRKPLPPFRLLVRNGQGQERIESADAVFDCTGTYAKPNWAGDGGIPALGELAARPHLSYWNDDILGAKKPAYSGRTVGLIGGGYSAATTALALASLADENMATWTVWLTHGPKTQPLPRLANDPLKERDRLAVKANSLACRCDGNIEYHAQAVVEEIVTHGPDKGFRVSARVNGKPTTWEVERLVANVGYRADLTLCQELRVTEPHGDPATAEPGYWILGAKSLGRDSGFLIRDAYPQIRRAVAAVVGNAKLDLYGKAA